MNHRLATRTAAISLRLVGSLENSIKLPMRAVIPMYGQFKDYGVYDDSDGGNYDYEANPDDYSVYSDDYSEGSPDGGDSSGGYWSE